MKKYITIFWLIVIFFAAIVLLIGFVGVYENLVKGDPDEWIPVGTMINWLGIEGIAIFTYKALVKK